jgi:HlyD family secretion protein
MNIFSRTKTFRPSRSDEEVDGLSKNPRANEFDRGAADGEFVEQGWSERATLRARPLIAFLSSSIRNRLVFAGTAVLAVAIATSTYLYVIPTTAVTYMIPSGPTWIQISGPGILDALQKVTITSRSTGFLKKIYADNNDHVKKGELIAELEAAELESQLAAAQADAEAAAQAVEQAKSDQTIAHATEDKAVADLNRRVPLHQSGIISSSEFDSTQMTKRQAAASLERAKTTIQRSIAQAAAASAQVQVLTARLEETKIRAPMDAIVVSRERSSGDLLVPGTTLFRLVDPSSMVISARLDESVMGLIQSGQDVSAQFISSPETTVRGTVLRVGRSVDTETREFVVDIVPKELPSNWAIGQRSSVHIRAMLPKAGVAIPQEMVARRNGQVGVWKLESGAAHWAAIDLGIFSGNFVAILSGLKFGDTVISPAKRYEYERIWPKDAAP